MSWSRRPRAAVLVAVTAESDQKSVLLSGDRVGGGIPDTLQVCSSWEHRVRILAASSVMLGEDILPVHSTQFYGFSRRWEVKWR